MSQELTTQNPEPTSLANLASIGGALAVSDSDFNSLTKASGFLGRIQLYSKGSAINHGRVMPGEFGIPESEDQITRLGKSIDVLPLARRPKAIDMSDTKNIVVSYDPASPDFKAIQDRSGVTDSGCMYGVSFLVFERTTKRFLEFFCGSTTLRQEAGKIYPFLPRVENGAPQPPRAVTLTSKVIEKGNYSWHGPVVSECSTPITGLPDVAVLEQEVKSFLNPKVEKVEKVADEAVANRRAR